MRILFAGTPQFALPTLEALARQKDITLCGVLTAPDKKAGRGKNLISSKVKEKALDLHLKIFTPLSLDAGFLEQIKQVQPDLLVVAAYGKIFKKEFLSLFPRGGINIHPSLLPRFRGPSPIPAAILAGDTETGVTIQRLALKMDQGNILDQARVPLQGTETTLELTDILGRLGAEGIIRVLRDMMQNHLTEIPQDNDAATYCHLIKKEDGCILWEEDALTIERKIRAYHPWPGAYTTYKGLQLLITSGSAGTEGTAGDPDTTANPGTGVKPGFVLKMDKKRGLQVCTGNGSLYITRLKLQTKREMNYKDFCNGHKDIINSTFGECIC